MLWEMLIKYTNLLIFSKVIAEHYWIETLLSVDQYFSARILMPMVSAYGYWFLKKKKPKKTF